MYRNKWREYEPFMYTVDADISPVLSRLQKGMIIDARIILCLDDDRYLIRISGYNTVMRSKFKYNKRDEIKLKVKATSPRLILQPLEGQKDSASGTTDLVV
jgi:hypothetical protein